MPRRRGEGSWLIARARGRFLDQDRPRGYPSVTSVSDLAELEAIQAMKARYFRCVDTKNWEGLAALFADDAVFDVGGDAAADRTLMRKGEYVKLHVDLLSEATSVHQGFVPELELTGPTTARGIWAMQDYLDFRGAPGPLPGKGTIVRGYGHYHEEYVKKNGEWQISYLRVARLRLEEFDSHEHAVSADTQ